MITAIAVDDEPLALEIIKAYCAMIDFIDLKHTFTEANTALKYLQHEPVNLLFLDINMPAVSGIDFYKMVSRNTMVIFTTAYSEYAIEGFNLSAVDYLLKPIDFKRFRQAVEKARDYYSYQQQKDAAGQQYLFVKVDYSVVKVPIAEILYVEGLDNYIKIHYDNGKHLLVRMSMKAISEKLPPGVFVRVHRSYIICFSKATAMRNRIIYIGGMEVPVGTNYIDDVAKLFKEKGQ